MKEESIEKIIHKFIKATNAFDVRAALALFALDAIIDDVSVREKFKGTTGIRNYLEKFFVDYHTVTKIESIEVLSNSQANAQVDFTGDFGHEKGGLNVTINEEGLIIEIGAFLH